MINRKTTMNGRPNTTDNGKKGDGKRSHLNTRVRGLGSPEKSGRIEREVRGAAESDPGFHTGKEISLRDGSNYPNRGSRSADNARGGAKMKAIYAVMSLGMILAFGFIVWALVALVMPAGVPNDNAVRAVPTHLGAGSLVSYQIKNCEENEFDVVTSVNVQSEDVPPAITVAVASPTPQPIHCKNIILIPQPLPTGDYRIIVFITYHINPVRDLLNPVKRRYVSNTIHVKNSNPNFVLPSSNHKATSAAPGKTMTVTAKPAAPKPTSEPKSVTKPATKPDTKPTPVQQAPTPAPKPVDRKIIGIPVVDGLLNMLGL